MNGNVKTGVAVVGGYLLGRTKKAKMAIGLGMFLAGRKLSFDPTQIGKLVANSPVLGSLNDQVRKELVDATKTAATGALTKRATGLADSLHERTQALNEPPKADDGSGPDEDASEDASSAADDGGEKPAPARKAAAKTASAKTSSAKSAATKGTSNAERGSGSGTASKARSASSNRTKSASGTATKTASKAGKTATSAARKPRGGGRNG
ncbi:hypothetical protein DSC45_04220 [Streptomyces sp. YIM 130001]|uniref:hypothetical protein n=1 Tax=Streptomyces sp. YIM 130001 TaxID=2259644 RepID=UPI000E650F4A|nr:hypothetical protein [Streptomyces sp. YIM 130001]RII20410.1 hypothetical protein DSC45_04220 [Streptomyces sp. YIM 130001]